MPTCVLLAVTLASLAVVPSAHAQEQYIYWIGAVNGEETKYSTVFRYALNGGVIDTLIRAADLVQEESQYDDPRYFYYLTVDTIGAKIYWTDSGGEIAPDTVILSSVLRASLDGDSVEIFLGSIVCGIGSLTDIDIDAADRTLYWGERSDCPDSGLRRTNLEGYNDPSVLSMDGDFRVASIALDPHNDTIYWAHNDYPLPVQQPVGIWRASLTDREPEVLVAEDACDIALAHTLSKLYWTPCDGNSIRRSNLDGTDAEDVIVSGGDPAKLAIDHKARRIYWTETAAGKIRRANLDGTDVEDLVSGLIEPASLALNFGWDSSVGVESEMALPESITIESVYPNPVRTSATIAFALTEPAHVALEIYDVLGRKVETLASRTYPPGKFDVQWSAPEHADGLYFCRIVSASGSQTLPIVVQR